MINRFGRADYIKITILGFGLTALWQSLHTIVLPLRLLDFVAESQKNTYLGLLTFGGLILAMAMQPISGAISDRSNFSWGKRRPYVLTGMMLTVLFLPGVGIVNSYAAIFIVYCLLQVSANSAQGPYQAFIPDLVPGARRGVASGIKTMLEIFGGVALIYPLALFMDHYAAGDGIYWLWLVLGVLSLVLLSSMLVTLLMVKEKPGVGGSQLSLLSTLYRSFRINVKENRNFIWFLVSRLLVFMSFTTVQTFTLYFLRDVVGLPSPAEATAMFSIVAVVGMLTAVYPAGYLSDRVGRRPLLVSSALVSALGILVVFLFKENFTVILFCGGMIGLSAGAFMSTNWALATDLVVKGEEARYLGLTNLATAGGAALARLIGPVIDFFNAYSVNLGYSVMLLLCFAYFITGALLLLKIGRRQPI